MLGIVNILDLVFTILEKANVSLGLVAQILASGKAAWAAVKIDFANVAEPSLAALAAKATEKRAALEAEPEPPADPPGK